MGVDDRLMPLPPLAEFVTELAAVSSDELISPDAARFDLASLRIEIPIEIEVDSTEEGAPVVRATPPTQWTRTTVMPVLHRLMVHIEAAPSP